MLETKCVCDNFEMLVTFLAVFVANILYLLALATCTKNVITIEILILTFKNCHLTFKNCHLYSRQGNLKFAADNVIPFPRSDIAILARAEILSKKKLKQTLRDESHKYIEQFTYRGMDGDEVRIGNDDWKLKLNKDCTKDSDAILRLHPTCSNQNM